LRSNLLKAQDFMKITHRFRGIYGTIPQTKIERS
jgi:hypothetical protein